MENGIKRKWSETEDSDDDEPSLGKQVLPVANLPDDFNGVPMDGLQYLFTVRYEVLVCISNGASELCDSEGVMLEHFHVLPAFPIPMRRRKNM